jgi:hypothetical protein
MSLIHEIEKAASTVWAIDRDHLCAASKLTPAQSKKIRSNVMSVIEMPSKEANMSEIATIAAMQPKKMAE